MSFVVDNRIESTGVLIGNGPLSHIFLKDNADYPWLILVPRVAEIKEIYQLSLKQRYQLMDEIAALSTIMQTVFNPDKLNTGALGNVVAQLHIHLIARFKQDKLWPQGIWQDMITNTSYSAERLNQLVMQLRRQLIDIPIFG